MNEKENAAMKDFYEKLTDEQKEKWDACKTVEEFTALAGESGIELPDDFIEAVTGGGNVSEPRPHPDRDKPGIQY